MIEFQNGIRRLPISDIEVGVRIRPVSDATVQSLCVVIEDFGFTVPILVRKTRSGYRLVDGAHRLEAQTRRGETEIDAVVVTCTDAEARAMEPGQNLAGAGMTPLDDALFLAAYSEAYQVLHPETKQGMAGALARHGMQGNLSSFAEVMAEKRSITPRQVRKIIAAGRALNKDEVRWLRAAPVPVTLADLQAIAKIDDDHVRAQACIKLSNGEVKKVSQAVVALTRPERPVQTLVEQQLSRLRASWQQSTKEARKRFLKIEGKVVFDLLREIRGDSE